MTYQQTARQQYYYCFTDDGKGKEQRAILKIDSRVRIASDKGFNLTKKEWQIVNILRHLPETCSCSLDSLTCAWLKECRKNGNFSSGDVVTGSNVKKAIQYLYINDERLFEFSRNNKGNFLLREVPYIDGLTTFEVIRK